MRWPFSRKANPANRVIHLGLSITGPETIPHKDFAGLAKNTYERNPTVAACVSTIAQACATVPWVVYERGKTSTSKTRRLMSVATHQKSQVASADYLKFPRLRKTLAVTEMVDHPLLKLLENPNELQSQTDYVEQLLSYLLIAGNGYEQFLAPESGPNRGRPIEMWNHRPDRIKIVPAKSKAEAITKGLIMVYRYESGGDHDDFPAASVIHHKFFHPTDDFYGLSPLQSAIRAWQTENLGADWNYALLNNAARPSGTMVIPSFMQDDAFERLKAELRESYAMSVNAGTPMLLEGGVKWEPMGLTPLEMDFLNGLRDAGIRICRVYHLAPEIIGIPDAKTYNSLAEARKAMWQEANLPLLDRLRNCYNKRVAPMFGDRIFLDYDRDQIDAIQEDQAKVWDKLGRARFLSTNEKRDAAGYETYDDPVADIPESILNPTPGATGQPGYPDNHVSSLRSAIDAFEGTPEQKAALLAALEGDDLDAKSQRLTRRQRNLEALIRTAMSRHFKGQGEDLAAFLRAGIRNL